MGEGGEERGRKLSEPSWIRTESCDEGREFPRAFVYIGTGGNGTRCDDDGDEGAKRGIEPDETSVSQRVDVGWEAVRKEPNSGRGEDTEVITRAHEPRAGETGERANISGYRGADEGISRRAA